MAAVKKTRGSRPKTAGWVEIWYGHNLIVSGIRSGRFRAKLWESVNPARHVDGKLVLDFGPYAPVEDRVRYVYSSESKSPFEFVFDPESEEAAQTAFPFGEKTSTYFQQTREQAIVLLLESPHAAEVEKSLTPKGPAFGSTGENIHESLHKLHTLLRSLEVEITNSPVVICNPVGYATSCRLPLSGDVEYKGWRDLVFSGFMARPERRSEFKQRLLGYDPIVVINACTGAYANFDTSPKGIVRQFLLEAFSDYAVRPVAYKRQGLHGPFVCDDQTRDLITSRCPTTTSDGPTVVLVEMPHPANNWTAKRKWIIPDAGSK